MAEIWVFHLSARFLEDPALIQIWLALTAQAKTWGRAELGRSRAFSNN